MTSQEVCFLCFVQHGMQLWKSEQEFWIKQKKILKKFKRSYLQVRKRRNQDKRVLSDLKTPKLKEILTKALLMSHQDKAITVLKTLIQ